MISIYSILALIPAEILAAYGSIFMKKGSLDFSLDPRKIKKSMPAAFGMFLFGLSMLLYIFALRFSDLSVIYPLSTITYIFVSLLSVKYLKEKMTGMKWLGIMLIIAGCFLVVR
ncbi:TPA: EamA family transporter [Candidatus Woesearchaeota archaeon]|nr:hypothetical protein QT06_C0001G0528 [archaeon GW2011_AR15]MBS3103839.1 EamA family transporter [Candidatus Woesearchaeota archaeon]HIH40835.1 EamA family transporter [Candidatus Woesearchaeota archaeon]